MTQVMSCQEKIRDHTCQDPFFLTADTLWSRVFSWRDTVHRCSFTYFCGWRCCDLVMLSPSTRSKKRMAVNVSPRHNLPPHTHVGGIFFFSIVATDMCMWWENVSRRYASRYADMSPQFLSITEKNDSLPANSCLYVCRRQ